jgi:hypothetical protein
MDFDLRPQRALQRAVEQLLRPLFRMLLRHSVSFRAFEEMAKHVYVDVALNDFAIPGKKPSASRVAVVSGLTRKEVQSLLNDANDDAEVSDRYNRAARVLTGWLRDAEFRDAVGRPRVLEADGEQGFSALVRRYSGDMPTRAVLDELVRVGAVRRLEDSRIELLAPGFVPKNRIEKMGILGRDVADLIETIDHNIESGDDDPRFQRKVMYDSIPVSDLPAFRKLSAIQAQALLEKLDRWLAVHDLDQTTEDTTTPRARVGIGIYYFEERLEPRTVEGDTP